jgi:hypothetical protein
LKQSVSRAFIAPDELAEVKCKNVLDYLKYHAEQAGKCIAVMGVLIIDDIAEFSLVDVFPDADNYHGRFTHITRYILQLLWF